MMTPEERFERIERQMEFIADQQAQFSTGLEKAREEWRRELREREALLQQQIDQHEKQIAALNGAVVALVATTHKLTEAQAKTEVGLKELTATSKETQERLNILIRMFERHLGEQHNGKFAPNEERRTHDT